MKRITAFLVLVALCHASFAQSHDYLCFDIGLANPLGSHEFKNQGLSDGIMDFNGTIFSVQYGHEINNSINWAVSMSQTDGIIKNLPIIPDYNSTLTYHYVTMKSGVDFYFNFGKRSTFTMSLQLGLSGCCYEDMRVDSQQHHDNFWILGCEASFTIRYDVKITDYCALGAWCAATYNYNIDMSNIKALYGSFGLSTKIYLK